MITWKYKCKKCGHTFSLSEDKKVQCPKCLQTFDNYYELNLGFDNLGREESKPLVSDTETDEFIKNLRSLNDSANSKILEYENTIDKLEHQVEHQNMELVRTRSINSSLMNQREKNSKTIIELNEIISGLNKSIIAKHEKEVIHLYPINSKVTVLNANKDEDDMTGKIVGFNIDINKQIRYIVRYWALGSYVENEFLQDEIQLPDETLKIPTLDFSRDDLGKVSPLKG